MARPKSTYPITEAGTGTVSITEPLIESETDLRHFDFMPLKVMLLRDSDFTALATPEEFRAGVLLWCAAWHQVPASSLPDDDRILCHCAGLGRDLNAWSKVRKMALHGFEKCGDGRYYHPIISALAAQAFKRKQGFEARLAAAREAKKLKKDKEAAELKASAKGSITESITERVIDPVHSGIGREDRGHGTRDIGHRTGESSLSHIASGPTFENFCAVYPKRGGSNPLKPARESWAKAVAKGVAPNDIIVGAAKYAAIIAAENQEGTTFVAQMRTWLNQERWKDNDKPAIKHARTGNGGGTYRKRTSDYIDEYEQANGIERRYGPENDGPIDVTPAAEPVGDKPRPREISKRP